MHKEPAFRTDSNLYQRAHCLWCCFHGRHAVRLGKYLPKFDWSTLTIWDFSLWADVSQHFFRRGHFFNCSGVVLAWSWGCWPVSHICFPCILFHSWGTAILGHSYWMSFRTLALWRWHLTFGGHFLWQSGELSMCYSRPYSLVLCRG